MEKKKTIADIGKILCSYAYKKGVDNTQVFNDFLRYSCDLAEWKEQQRCGGLVQRMKECKEQNPDFFEAFTILCHVMYEANLKGEALDGLGTLYEKMFQTSSKASRTGQFFTPQDLCRLMAEISVPRVQKDADEVTSYNDCACGSGRTLLAAWEKCDKYRKNYFTAQDIDSTSVMMCALNFMINGMVGIVECQNTLTMEWHHGYIVNACKVPYANNMCSLERYENKDEFRARERKLMILTSIWDVEKYRPEKKVG